MRCVNLDGGVGVYCTQPPFRGGGLIVITHLLNLHRFDYGQNIDPDMRSVNAGTLIGLKSDLNKRHDFG